MIFDKPRRIESIEMRGEDDERIRRGQVTDIRGRRHPVSVVLLNIINIIRSSSIGFSFVILRCFER